MGKFRDVADLREDDRIDIIGQHVMAGQSVGFVTDDEPGKMDRYLAKLKAKFPAIQVEWRKDGPVAETVSAKVSIPKG
jgi:hypothetical protein